MKFLKLFTTLMLMTQFSFNVLAQQKGLECQSYYMQLLTTPAGKSQVQTAFQFFNLGGSKLSDGVVIPLNENQTFRDESGDEFFGGKRYAVVTKIITDETEASLDINFEVTETNGSRTRYSVLKGEKFAVASGLHAQAELKSHYSPTFIGTNGITIYTTHVGVTCLPKY